MTCAKLFYVRIILLGHLNKTIMLSKTLTELEIAFLIRNARLYPKLNQFRVLFCIAQFSNCDICSWLCLQVEAATPFPNQKCNSDVQLRVNNRKQSSAKEDNDKDEVDPVPNKVVVVSDETMVFEGIIDSDVETDEMIVEDNEFDDDIDASVP